MGDTVQKLLLVKQPIAFMQCTILFCYAWACSDRTFCFYAPPSSAMWSTVTVQESQHNCGIPALNNLHLSCDNLANLQNLGVVNVCSNMYTVFFSSIYSLSSSFVRSLD